MAGYGLRAFLISQSLNQIDKAYGQNHSILDNCHVRVTFATNDERTAKRISETLGTATELRAQRNYAGHRLAPWLGHLMVSRQETARPLLTPGEVMQLPTDESVVMLSGHAPIRAKSCAISPTPTSGTGYCRRRNCIRAVTPTHLRPAGRLDRSGRAYGPWRSADRTNRRRIVRGWRPRRQPELAEIAQLPDLDELASDLLLLDEDDTLPPFQPSLIRACNAPRGWPPSTLTMKLPSSRARLNLFIQPEHAKRLNELAITKGVSKSSIIAAALASWLSPDSGDQRETAIAKRLDRLSRQFERLERDQNILIETVAPMCATTSPSVHQCPRRTRKRRARRASCALPSSSSNSGAIYSAGTAWSGTCTRRSSRAPRGWTFRRLRPWESTHERACLLSAELGGGVAGAPHAHAAHGDGAADRCRPG